MSNIFQKCEHMKTSSFLKKEQFGEAYETGQDAFRDKIIDYLKQYQREVGKDFINIEDLILDVDNL